MRPGFRILYQWLASVAWIQMNVAAECPVVTSVFDQESFVSSLIKMSSSAIAFGMPVCISGQPMLHAAGQIGLRCLDQRMNMIWHPAVGQHDPPASRDLVLQTLGKTLVMTLVIEQLSSTITVSDDPGR